MYWLEKMREFKKERNMTYKQISDKTGIALTTVEKLFSGRTGDPKLNMISKIADALGHTLSDFVEMPENTFSISDNEKNMLVQLRNLDDDGKRRVNDTIKGESDRVTAQKNSMKVRFNKIYYDFPVSAGTGQYLDNRTAVIAELSDEPPRGTDYIVRIAGESMEPIYHDGDYIYVSSCDSIGYGEVGIFVAEGSVYMKEYSHDGLKSFNPDYGLIKFYDDVRCLGKVLGRLQGDIEVPFA